eukprot:CAMPEP_0168519008 /NCGR_PEP_ID=MMETSP0405-20121227/7059_1 /TAXON_ID=498012 /ORGANISM="Trichosphaerium sp, Strain Am-I-7 wt" /LENGTH=140 /DNA_ID=CAMNT_0008539463 /DNA_START=300 /DNA_END=722 /DNA_ORIENTATION=-
MVLDSVPSDVKAVWKNASRDQIVNQKLLCSFSHPEGTSSKKKSGEGEEAASIYEPAESVSHSKRKSNGGSSKSSSSTEEKYKAEIAKLKKELAAGGLRQRKKETPARVYEQPSKPSSGMSSYLIYLVIFVIGLLLGMWFL